MIVTSPRSPSDGVLGSRVTMMLWFVSFQTLLSPRSRFP